MIAARLRTMFKDHRFRSPVAPKRPERLSKWKRQDFSRGGITDADPMVVRIGNVEFARGSADSSGFVERGFLPFTAAGLSRPPESGDRTERGEQRLHPGSLAEIHGPDRAGLAV